MNFSILRLAFLASVLATACNDDPINNAPETGMDAGPRDAAVDDSTPPGSDVMDAVAQRSDAGVSDGD